MSFGIYKSTINASGPGDQLLHFEKVVNLTGQPIDITYDESTNTVLFTEKNGNSATRIGQYSLDDLLESTVIDWGSNRK